MSAQGFQKLYNVIIAVYFDVVESFLGVTTSVFLHVYTKFGVIGPYIMLLLFLHY